MAEKHVITLAKYGKMIRKKLKAAGLCIVCVQPQAETSTTRCERCLAKARRSKRTKKNA